MKIEYKYDISNVCALICAYNEQDTIFEVSEETQKYVDDVIIVNDGSSDNTQILAEESGARMLLHKNNMGKGQAFKTGFQYFLNNTDYQHIVALDADFQHPPDHIPYFLQKLEEGYDAAIGKRSFTKENSPLLRRLCNKLDSKKLSKALGINLPDPQNGFRAFTRSTLANTLKNISEEGFGFEIEHLMEMVLNDYQIGWVDIPTIYDNKIKSHIKPFHHAKNSIRLWREAKKRRISKEKGL